MKVIIEGTEGELNKALSVIKGFKVTITDEVGEPFFKKVIPPPVKGKNKDKKGTKGKNNGTKGKNNGTKGKNGGSPKPEESELPEVNEENKTEQ